MRQSTCLKKFALSLLCATVSAVATASPIGTTASFNLTSTSNLQSNTTLATVMLTQTAINEVDVSVMLASGGYFAGTGAGYAFAFNLLPAFGTSATVVSLLGTYSQSYFTVNPYAAPGNSAGDYEVSSDGIFTNSIDLSSNGASKQITGPLTFMITSTGIGLEDFTTSTARNKGQKGGYEFAVDMSYGGKTGSAGFIDNGSGGDTGGKVPEPGSFALMGLGMLGVAFLRKRNKA